MPDNFQHKIFHFDIQPPRDMWQKIADQLDKEYESGDVMISKKLHDYEIIPPAFIFDNVLAGLVTDQSIISPARVFTLPLKRVAVAAITIGLVIISVVYFLSPGSRTTQNSTANIIPSTAETPSVPPTETDKRINNEQSSSSGIASLNQSSNKKFVQSNARNRTGGKHVSLNPVLAASAISPISVNAPPIYDGDGNIIMDENLVSAPDENYIVVTSPNGEQTKISRKFLKMLCVMNSGPGSSYNNIESYLWKVRFEEWRSKLLQQASYIPTANNFLDIMDLKELLQED